MNNTNKRLYKNHENDISELEHVFSNVDITENIEYTLLKNSLNTKYRNDDSMIDFLNGTGGLLGGVVRSLPRSGPDD